MRDAMLGALRTKAADAPGRNEAPRTAAAAAPAPELKGKGAEVRGLEARYDEIVDDQIDAQGHLADAKLIKSAALASKGSFVVSAMAEPTGRFQALNRRIEELVGLDNTELAKIANEPVPEATPEAAMEAAPEAARATAAAVEAMPETKSGVQMQLENLASVEGLASDTGIDTAKLEEIVVSALGDTKTDWTKVDAGFLEAVGKVLEDLKTDKAQAAPEYPFLKVNRINKALEDVRQGIEAHVKQMKEIEGARETATRIAGGETAPAVAREMSPAEELAHMKKQFNIKDAALDSLILKLNDYLKVPGFFRGLKGHARDLKRQIRDLEAEQDKLSKAIYSHENKSPVAVRSEVSQARNESITKPTEKSPY